MRAVEALKRVKTANEDQKHGVEIVRKAITWPARQIAINAGEDGSVVVGKIVENDTYAYGFDAQSGEFGNLVTKGIIDPTKVVRIALQDGSSIAGLFAPPPPPCRWGIAPEKYSPKTAPRGTADHTILVVRRAQLHHWARLAQQIRAREPCRRTNVISGMVT